MFLPILLYSTLLFMNKQMLITAMAFATLAAQAQIRYPAAPKDNTVDDYFGGVAGTGMKCLFCSKILAIKLVICERITTLVDISPLMRCRPISMISWFFEILSEMSSERKSARHTEDRRMRYSSVCLYFKENVRFIAR